MRFTEIKNLISENVPEHNQNNLPLISVVVAVLNAKETLQHCIDSIISQTYPCKELIIIDGGSTDGTVDILRANDSHITCWKSEPDQGIYQAWNKALQVLRGDYICFLGADDYWHDNNCMGELAQAGVANRFPDLVSGIIVVLDDNGTVLERKGEVWNFRRMKKRMTTPHPGMFHHRRLFEKYGLFLENYKIAGDYEFLLRLGEGVSHVFIDRVMVCRGANGVSRTNIKKSLYETFLIQSGNQEIGAVRALVNYSVAYIKHIGKQVLRGLLQPRVGVAICRKR